MLGGMWRNSWRNSNQTLESKDENDGRKKKREPCSRPAKSVHFPDDSNELVSEIPQQTEPLTEDDLKVRWYQMDDYQRFEKDRLLTSFGYISSRRIGGPTIDSDLHSLRGLELLTDSRLCKREAGERKALIKALRVEEQRQRLDHTFPDMEKFSAISQKYTNGSRSRAWSVAQQDAREAQARSRFMGPMLMDTWSKSPLSRLHRKSVGSTVRCGSLG